MTGGKGIKYHWQDQEVKEYLTLGLLSELSDSLPAQFWALKTVSHKLTATATLSLRGKVLSCMPTAEVKVVVAGKLRDSNLMATLAQSK